LLMSIAIPLTSAYFKMDVFYVFVVSTFLSPILLYPFPLFKKAIRFIESG
jgi:hypothetical protein